MITDLQQPYKVCSKCWQGKNIEDFHVGYARCKACHLAQCEEIRARPETKALAKAYAVKRKQDLRSGIVPYARKQTKFCAQCKQVKSASDFCADLGRIDGLTGWCKYCHNVNTNYNTVRIGDKRKGRNTCTRAEWKSLIYNQHCLYCGEGPVTGGDRIDNSKGHTKDNLVPCCAVCNITRMDNFTHQEMILYIGPTVSRIREARREYR